MRRVQAAEVARVLVIGSGGYARVCVEALEDDAATLLVGVLSNEPDAGGGWPVPVLASETDLRAAAAEVGADSVFVAVEDNAARAALMSRCDALALPSVVATSRFAQVSRSVRVGRGTAILAGGVVARGTVLGQGVLVNTRAGVDRECVIGDHVHVSQGATLCPGVRVGAGTFIGPGATLAANVSVGARAVVAAGSVVLHDIPDGAMVSGSPARSHGRAGS
jgi:UDP-perosamine 4-acetyltransferase